MARLVSSEVRMQIKSLRETGHSIPEIHRLTGKSKSTVSRLTQGVKILPAYENVLRIKQGGAKKRAQLLRSKIEKEVCTVIQPLSERDLLLLLIGLYWGEGTKRDFGIINSDPYLILAFINCLQSIGVAKERLSMSLRIHSDISPELAKQFWSEITGISKNSISRMEIVDGKKKGKLKYGMCRIRVRSGIKERLFIQFAIGQIGKDSCKRISSKCKLLS